MTAYEQFEKIKECYRDRVYFPADTDTLRMMHDDILFLIQCLNSAWTAQTNKTPPESYL